MCRIKALTIILAVVLASAAGAMAQGVSGAQGVGAQVDPPFNQCATLRLREGCSCRPGPMGEAIVTCDDAPPPMAPVEACLGIPLQTGCRCDTVNGSPMITCNQVGLYGHDLSCHGYGHPVVSW